MTRLGFRQDAGGLAEHGRLPNTGTPQQEAHFYCC